MGIDGQAPYATRRKELDDTFRSLPPTGSPAYWAAIETQIADQALPLEVVGRCLQERHNAGRRGDAERIFKLIVGRIQRTVEGWSGSIAQWCRKADPVEMRRDLQQECYATVWRELTDAGPSFIFEHFPTVLRRIEQHIAETVMTREGEWKRRGVKQSTRVLSDALESIERSHSGSGEAEMPMRELPDSTSSDAMSRAEREIDVSAALAALDADARDLLYDVFWRCLTQDEIAQKLQMTDRTVRNRLKRVLNQFREQYLGGEEEQRD